MREVIQAIIQNQIPKGCIFDAHSIIDYLIQNYSNDYLTSYRNGTTEFYHSEISKTVDSFNGVIIERVSNESWSLNLHKKFTKNACWIKL